ncbi:MAG TPA: DUF3857 domain-containing protein [Thermoanaerobaculia bacterium]|nr:DUF3857 domain-containing protein [Thermoanaerobaculia bacterium]
MKQRLLLVFLPVLVTALSGLRLEAQAFPPIADEERALTFVPGEPNAPAVVLFRKGELLMQGYGSFFGSYNSHMRVLVREKILTESGRGRGEISIFHSEFTRLEGFSGRTVLPDGSIVPVPPGAKFERRASRSKRIFVTAVAFPAVQVGAILDYQYELVFSSPFDLEPWWLSDAELPVRRAEVVYETAPTWRMQFWSRSPLGVVIHKEETDSSFKGHRLRAWAENLPSLPQEPDGPPLGELAAQVLLLPAAERANTSEPVLWFDSWRSTSDLFQNLYGDISIRSNGVERQVRAIAPSGTPRQKAEALYRFVRDEIQTVPSGYAVGVDPADSVSHVLSTRRGTCVEKVLLLGKMFFFADIKAGLIWARDRDLGVATDPKAPNPAWFDAVFMKVKLDGQDFFLDPADRGLGFGQLPMAYEGTAALIPSVPPQGLTLPATPFDQNLRRAEVELTLDAGGRLSGTGTLLLTGGPGWEKVGWKQDPAQTVEAWKQWLAERFRDFQIAEVKAAETPEARKVTVTWTLAQRQDEVLGDEVSITASAPLGPLVQPFVQTPAQRRTSVAFDYPYRDEVELRLHWPEGWNLEAKPTPAVFDSPPGSFLSAVTTKPEERTLLYHRRMDVVRRDVDIAQYAPLRSLFAAVETSDGQKLVLVRRP